MQKHALDSENLRYIYWLNQKLVHHHAHLLGVERTLLGSGETVFGAKMVTNIVLL